MGKVRVSIRMPFGEVSLEGDSGSEILEILRGLPEGFLEEIEGLISSKLTSLPSLMLKDLVEYTTEGPIIIAKKKISHYEAIGLLLYAIEGGLATASKLKKLLEASGIRAMVPARLNEMAKRGLVFKPDPAKHDWQLTAQGRKWIEEEVIPKLRGEGD